MRDLDKYEKDYAGQPYERFQVRFRKRKIRETLDRHPHRRILEIGCGLEPLFRDFADFDHLTILEPAQLFHQRAEAELASHPARAKVQLLAATLEASPPLLGGRQFDLILLSSLLHEMPQPEQFLRQVAALAGPETIVHVNVPNALSFHRLLAFESGLIASSHQLSASNQQFQQSTVFDLPALQTLAVRCDLTVLESGSYSLKPFTHRQMEDLIQAGILSEQIIDGLYAMEQYAPGCGSEIFVNLRRNPA
jgi:SAM-dependent methyltransferase